MNPNIKNTQIFHKIKYDLKGHFYVIKKFRDVFTSNLIKNLTVVLMDNFYNSIIE